MFALRMLFAMVIVGVMLLMAMVVGSDPGMDPQAFRSSGTVPTDAVVALRIPRTKYEAATLEARFVLAGEGAPFPFRLKEDGANMLIYVELPKDGSATLDNGSGAFTGADLMVFEHGMDKVRENWQVDEERLYRVSI